MTDTQRAAMFRMLKEQRKVSLASAAAARESLMRTGLYNDDGTLKAEYGGKRKHADE